MIYKWNNLQINNGRTQDSPWRSSPDNGAEIVIATIGI